MAGRKTNAFGLASLLSAGSAANTINAIFQKALSEQELKQLIQELVKRRYITIENSSVSYHLPTVT